MGPAALLILVLFLWPGCGRGPEPEPPPLRVAASTPWLADVARHVGGEWVTVVAVGPVGRRVTRYEPEPPTYAPWQPDPDAARALTGAHLILTSGLGEEWATAALADPATDPRVTRLDLLEPGRAAARGADGPAGALWLDPAVLKAAAHEAAARLGRLRPERAADFRDRAEALAAQVDSVLDEVGRSQRLSAVVVLDAEPVAMLRALGVRAVRVARPAGALYPSPADVAAAARRARVPTVLIPAAWGEPAAREWARQTGLDVRRYDATGGPLPDAPRPTAVEALRFNLSELRL